MYPIFLSISIAAAFLWLSLVEPLPASSQEEQVKITSHRIEAGLAALIGALLLARLTHVGLYFSIYRQQPLDILAVWQGGLTAWGGMIGAVAGLALYCQRRNSSCWSLADALAAPANLIALSLWLACLLEGCAYGRSAAGSILAIAGPDMIGIIQPRWPVQSIGALASIGFLAGSFYGRHQDWPPGAVSLPTLLAHGLLLLGLSWLRADPVRYFGDLRSDTLGSGLILFIALIFYYGWWRSGERHVK